MLKHIKHPDIEIVLRKDFYSKFDTLFKELAVDVGLQLFHHNLIHNYREVGHKVSTFGNNEEWSEIYWDKYCNNDLLESSCNVACKKNGFAITSWHTIDPTSECMDARLRICKVKDGISVVFKHSNNLMENITFGWKKLNFELENFGFQKFAALNQLIAPVRQHHLKMFNKDMSS